MTPRESGIKRSPSPVLVYGFEVSEGLIPQERGLFWRPETRDAEAESILQLETMRRDWRDLVAYTASANLVESELPPEWDSVWSSEAALLWLTQFDYVGDGADFEMRKFEGLVI